MPERPSVFPVFSTLEDEGEKSTLRSATGLLIGERAIVQPAFENKVIIVLKLASNEIC